MKIAQCLIFVPYIRKAGIGEWALLVKYMVSMFSETNFIYNQSTESADVWFPEII